MTMGLHSRGLRPRRSSAIKKIRHFGNEAYMVRNAVFGWGKIEIECQIIFQEFEI